MTIGVKMTKLASKMGLHSSESSSKSTKRATATGTQQSSPVERRVTRSMTAKLRSKKTSDSTEEALEQEIDDTETTVPTKRKARGSDASQRSSKKPRGEQMISKPNSSSRFSNLGSRIRERARSFTIPTRPASKRSSRKAKPIRMRCEVCGDERDPASFPDSLPCEDHVVCLTCVRSHISVSINNGEANSIKCLVCKQMWTATSILSFLGPQDQERYTQATLSVNPRYRKCLALGCDFGQIHEPGLRKPVVECQKCHAKSCFGHRVPWHEGETCARYADRLMTAMENETEEAKKARVKEENVHKEAQNKCQSCDGATQKLDGCDTTECTKCKKKFCALCLEDMEAIYQQGNHKHKGECKHWRQPGWDENGDVEKGLTKVGVIGDGPPMIVDPYDDEFSGDEFSSGESQDSTSPPQGSQTLPSIAQALNTGSAPPFHLPPLSGLTPLTHAPPTFHGSAANPKEMNADKASALPAVHHGVPGAAGNTLQI